MKSTPIYKELGVTRYEFMISILASRRTFLICYLLLAGIKHSRIIGLSLISQKNEGLCTRLDDSGGPKL